jgi:DNA-binding MarR family transcriptional regulator
MVKQIHKVSIVLTIIVISISMISAPVVADTTMQRGDNFCVNLGFIGISCGDGEDVDHYEDDGDIDQREDTEDGDRDNHEDQGDENAREELEQDRTPTPTDVETVAPTPPPTTTQVARGQRITPTITDKVVGTTQTTVDSDTNGGTTVIEDTVTSESTEQPTERVTAGFQRVTPTVTDRQTEPIQTATQTVTDRLTDSNRPEGGERSNAQQTVVETSETEQRTLTSTRSTVTPQLITEQSVTEAEPVTSRITTSRETNTETVAQTPVADSGAVQTATVETTETTATETVSTGNTDTTSNTVIPSKTTETTVTVTTSTTETPTDGNESVVGASSGDGPQPDTDTGTSSSNSGWPFIPLAAGAVGTGVIAGGVIYKHRTGNDLLGRISEWIKRFWWTVFETTDDDVILNETQSSMLYHVQSSPGISQSDVAKEIGVRKQTVSGSVEYLKDNELITDEKRYSNRRYFPYDEYSDEMMRALTNMPGTTRDVLVAILDGAASNKTVAAELDCSPSTVSHHLNRLDDNGLIDREGDITVTIDVSKYQDALDDFYE